jgi:hypothetical protein
MFGLTTFSCLWIILVCIIGLGAKVYLFVTLSEIFYLIIYINLPINNINNFIFVLYCNVSFSLNVYLIFNMTHSVCVCGGRRRKIKFKFKITYLLHMIQTLCFWTLSILLFYLKHTQRFRDWTLFPSSCGTYSVGPN